MLAPLIRNCPRSEDPGLTHKQRGLSRATFDERGPLAMPAPIRPRSRISRAPADAYWPRSGHAERCGVTVTVATPKRFAADGVSCDAGAMQSQF